MAQWTAEPKELGRAGLMGAGNNTLYTVPALKKATLTEILIHNAHTANVTVTVHLVKTGQSVGNGFIVLNEIIQANETLPWAACKILEAGDFISAVATVASVINIWCDGAELTSL